MKIPGRTAQQKEEIFSAKAVRGCLGCVINSKGPLC